MSQNYYRLNDTCINKRLYCRYMEIQANYHVPLVSTLALALSPGHPQIYLAAVLHGCEMKWPGDEATLPHG